MSGSGSIWDSLSGVTATSDELNLLDGGTSVGSSITIVNTDGFIVNDAGTTKLIPASDVATYAAASAGDITAVTAGDGLTGGGTTGALTLNVGAGTGIDVASDAISVDVSDFLTNGADNRLVTATGTDAMNGEASLTFDGNTLTVTDLVTDTNAGTFTAVDINFDKSGSSTSNNTMIGINLDIDNTSATGGNNEMVGIKVTPTLTHASGSGTATCKGIEIVATGATSTPQQETVRALDIVATGAETNQGIFMKVDNGTGPDIKMISSANSGDSATITTGANGEFTISTTDADAALAHINLEPDGDVVIKGATPKLIIGDAGAEDTMLVFDGNAVDYRMGIDDSEDLLEIGVGTTHGTTAALLVTPNADVEVLGTLGINALIADESSSGIHSMFTAGEALVRGDVVYFKAGDSKMYKVNMTTGNADKIPAVAMAANDISSDAVGKFLLQGFVRDNGTFPSYTIAGRLYAPEAEGPPTQTAPSTDGDIVQVIGWAVTADMIYFNPSNDIIEVA